MGGLLPKSSSCSEDCRTSESMRGTASSHGPEICALNLCADSSIAGHPKTSAMCIETYNIHHGHGNEGRLADMPPFEWHVNAGAIHAHGNGAVQASCRAVDCSSVAEASVRLGKKNAAVARALATTVTVYAAWLRRLISWQVKGSRMYAASEKVTCINCMHFE